MSALEEAALAYAQQGLHVFPLQPNGKTPLTAHGLEDATTDPLTIETWWSRWPDANIAIRTGDVVVVDEDRLGALDELAAEAHEQLPASGIVKTGTGRHFYYRQPADTRIRNTAGKLAPGIDTRGDGGYVVAPPSIHPSGSVYAWEAEITDAVMPAWIVKILTYTPPRQPMADIPFNGSTPYGQRALEDELQAVATAPEGTRNDSLNRAAFALGQLVAGGEVDSFDAQRSLDAAAQSCGLPLNEARKTIQSGFTSGMENPRRAPDTGQRPVVNLRVVREEAPPSPAPRLSIVPLEQFAGVVEESATPLIGLPNDSLLPSEGLLLMYGDGGAGKTTLTVDAVAHIAAGQAWLQVAIPEPVRVLLIENEGPRGPFRETLAHKLARWDGTDFKGNVRVLEEPWAQFTLSDPQFRQAIADEIGAQKTQLVVVGPLASLGAKGTGTPDDVSDFAALIADMRSRTEQPFALWIVHHENKAGDVSGAWERLPDTLVHVSAQGNGKTRVLWRKVRWSSRLHNTSVTLTWDDANFKIEEKRDRDYESELLVAMSTSDETWFTSRDCLKALKDASEDGKAANREKVEAALEAMRESGRCVYEVGPAGRHVNARCYRLSVAQDARSHTEPHGQSGDAEDDVARVARPIRESHRGHIDTDEQSSGPEPLSHIPDPDEYPINPDDGIDWS